MLPRRIFHPTDFSPCADAALRFALEAAMLFEAELHVGHVVYGGRDYWDVDGGDEDDHIETRLREVVVRELSQVDDARAGKLDVSYHVLRHETPADGVTRFAEEREIDLVVMGTHGRRGIRRFLLGSVAFKVMHSSRRDLVLVPAGVVERTEGRLLVPLDLHERSTRVVSLAGELAQALQAPIDFVHVLDLPEEFRLRADDILSANLNTLHDVALGRLGDLVGDLDASLTVETHALSGHPASTILNRITEHDVRLVLMAASGMSPKERLRTHPHDRELGDEIRWAVGPVAERISAVSSAPVWIIKRFANEDDLVSMRQEREEPATY